MLSISCVASASSTCTDHKWKERRLYHFLSFLVGNFNVFVLNNTHKMSPPIENSPLFIRLKALNVHCSQ